MRHTEGIQEGQDHHGTGAGPKPGKIPQALLKRDGLSSSVQ
jgi:hypothetical protein